MDARLTSKEKITDMWCQLNGAWSVVEGHENPMWSKKCRLFDVFIEKFDVNTWEFEIIGDGFSLHQQEMKSTSLEDAQSEGNQLIIRFLVVGLEILTKTKIDLTIPPGEVRFTQIVDIHGQVYGLSTEGLLYKWTYPSKGGPMGWSPVHMDIVPEPKMPAG